MKSIAIVCVLKTGGPYTWKDVLYLKERVSACVSLPYTFYCWSDEYVPVEGCMTIDLIGNYPGWWSKIELFDSYAISEERIVYFDLDTLLIKDIDEFLKQEAPFIGLRPFNPVNRKRCDLASGIMAWNNDGSFDFIYKEFSMMLAKQFRGDQDYITHKLREKGIKYMYWQNKLAGVYSYKRHYIHHLVKKDARVICFHGEPRMNTVNLAPIINTLS